MSNVNQSNPKSPGKKSCKFFDFYLHTKSDVRRAVCFSPQKRTYTKSLSNRNQPVEIKKVRITTKDIIVSENTIVKEIDVDFKKKEQQIEFSSIKEILFKKELYDKVSVKAVVENVKST